MIGHKAVLQPILVSPTRGCVQGGTRSWLCVPVRSKLKVALGGDNNLAVVIRKYEPKIHCGSVDTFRVENNCGLMLAAMPAKTEKLRFGPEQIPGVEEPLPQLITAGELFL